MDDAAFVLGDGAEGAAAEAATHDVDRVFDHFPCGDFRVAVRRVRIARVGQSVYKVHFLGGERDGLNVEPDVSFAMLLYQCAGVAWVGFEVQHARGVRVQHGIVRHCFVRGNADHAVQALVVTFGHAFGFGQQFDWLFLRRVAFGAVFAFSRWLCGVQIRVGGGELCIRIFRRIHGG